MSWDTVKLADLAAVSSGGGAPQNADAFGTEGTPFVRAGSLVKLLNGSSEEELELLSADVAKAHKLKLFPAGTVLFAKSGMSATKGHVYQLKKPAYVVNHLAALIPHSELSGRYLRHVLKFKSPTSLIKDEAYPSIRLGEIENMEVPAPASDDERERIAAILDKADELRSLRQRAIERLNSLGQAIFYDMFGNVAKNSKNLPRERVGDHCERVSVGVVVKPASYYQESGIPAVRGTNIKPGGIDLSDIVYFSKEANAGPLKKSRINAGDVLAVRSGRPGLAAVVPPELDGANCIDVLIATTRKDSLLPEYLRDFLNSSDGRHLVLSNSVGQVQQHFNVKSLAEAEIPLPSIVLQSEYVEKMRSLDANRSMLIEGLHSLDTFFASLQHRAFAGEL